ncbi:MAG: indole-3-glycerol-phosphate synthase [Planctomycetes bacterium]|nr:indole-3-glycerol-phosphate synthase [Planctomycetota bacterium]
MPDFLKHMAAESARRAAEARAATPEAEMRAAAEAMPPALPLALPTGEMGVIAEIKRVSPAAGVLNAAVDPAVQARAYEAAGASAVSVLTEPTRFHGSLLDLRAARETATLPLMRKDFIGDAYQIYEARAAGADGVLLIVAMLSDRELRHYLRVCDYLGMFALVECFDADDVKRAQATDARVIGINSRNLRDLRVEFERFEQLRGLIEPGRTAVAESGISTPAQFHSVRRLGYHAALVGSALMRQADPAAALARLRNLPQEATR